MKNKLFFFFIILFSLFLLSSPTLADYKEHYDDFIIEVDNGKVEIVRYLGNKKDLIIPDEIKGNLVVEIKEDAFSNNLSLEKINLPEHLTQIEEKAFYRCNNLKSINFNSKLREIEEKAFAYCSSLDCINIPGSIRKIPEKCFLACNSLNSVEVSEGVKSVEEKAFKNCPNLTYIVLPASINKIDNEAFDISNKLKIVAPKNSYAERFAQENVYSNSENNEKPGNPITIPLKEIEIINDNIRLSIGQTETLRLKFIPSDATNKKVTFKSLNPNIVTVSESGIITALSSGKTEILVISEENNISEDCDVYVYETTPPQSDSNTNLINDLDLNRDDILLNPGETFQLKAFIYPSEFSNEPLIWFSNNPDVAIVDQNGLVTAISSGKAEIEVSTIDGRINEDCSVRVKGENSTSNFISVKKVKLDRDDLFLIPGESLALNIRILPENATNKAIYWVSSNTNVATVDQNGKVTAIGNGKAEIKAISEDGNHDDDCDVIVFGKDQSNINESENIPVRDIDIDDDLYLNLNSIYKLNIRISPSNATNQSVTFKSLNESIVTVDEYGLVTAKGEGQTKVIATTADGNHQDDCDVFVGNINRDPQKDNPILLRDIDINDDLVLTVGDNTILTVRFIPNNATNTNVIWSSLTPDIVSVDQNGKITALKSGFGKIKVVSEDGNFEDSSKIIVNEKALNSVDLEKIILNSTSAEILTGESLSLKAYIIPSNANEQIINWKSLNPTVIQIDNTGVLKALKPGTSEIIAQNSNGNISAQCLITVSDSTKTTVTTPSVIYTVHVQDYGWGNEVKNGLLAGTTGQCKRLEGIKIYLDNSNNGIRYKTHVQDIGWQDWKNDNELSGTTGKAKRLEAIQIELKEDYAKNFDVYYRVHIEDLGWMNWAKNGEPAGSTGLAKRLEAIQIQVIPKESPIPICNPEIKTNLSFIQNKK